MTEFIILLLAAFVAWHTGVEVAEDRYRNVLVVVLAMALAAFVAASRMVIDGLSVAVFIVAIIAGLLGKARAHQLSTARLRADELQLQHQYNTRKEVT